MNETLPAIDKAQIKVRPMPQDLRVDALFLAKTGIWTIDFFQPSIALMDESCAVLASARLLLTQQLSSAWLQDSELAVCTKNPPRFIIWRWETGPGQELRFAEIASHSLPAGAMIIAIAKRHDDFLLLDKRECCLRVVDRLHGPKQIVGSRLGYWPERMPEKRIGFEMPEDIAVMGEEVLVSDSGNRRLVVLSSDLTRQRGIPLPLFPLRFASISAEGVVLTDFHRSLIYVSWQYGFAAQQTIGYPMLSATLRAKGNSFMVISERHELLEVAIDTTPMNHKAEICGNASFLLRQHLAETRIAAAWAMVQKSPSLFWEFLSACPTANFTPLIWGAVRFELERLLKEKRVWARKISASSRAFIASYMALPTNPEYDSANVAKEIVRAELVDQIREFRSNLNKISLIISVTEKAKSKFAYIKRISSMMGQLQRRMNAYRSNVFQSLEIAEERKLTNALVQDWLATEEWGYLFSNKNASLEPLFPGAYLSVLLDNFCYTVAKLHLRQNNVASFCHWAQRELLLFPGKVSVLYACADELLRLHLYELALQHVHAFMDSMPRQQNKLHLQYLLYRIHYALGDKAKAGEYLLREWQLFPHRLDILPEVLALNLLDQQQAEALLRSIQVDYTENMDKHLVAACLLWQKGDIAKAWQHIERELALFPENQRALDCKWNLLIAQHKWPEALSWSERFPKKNQINHHYNLYRIYRGLQDHQLAANHLRQELQLHPHRVELIAELLTLENLEPSAVFALIRPMMKSIKPPPLVVQQLVKYFADRGERSYAVASLDWQLQFDPKNTQLIEQKRQLGHASGQPAGKR